MKSISFIVGAFGAAIIAAGSAYAQNAEYDAEAIIKHFENSGGGDDCAASGDCIAKSGTRGLSIGSSPAKPVPAATAPASTAPAPTATAPAAQPAATTTTTTAAPAATEPRMGEIAPAATSAAAQPATQSAAAPAPEGFNLLITFQLGSAQLTPQAQTNLDQFASAVSDPRLSNAVFAIDGHTDASGGDAQNMALSERRAASVVEYLTAKGVDSSRLVPRGFGEESPRMADPYDGANRRVEASLISQ